MQRASARELKPTSALKSSPPPELILENDNTGRSGPLATSRWLSLKVTTSLVTPFRPAPGIV
jgi:hypothetical protein